MTAGQPPPPDLERERTEVLAAIAGSPMSIRPPTAHAVAPLRALPAAVETKLAARAQAGLVPFGTEHPRGRVWQRVVVPSGTLAAVDVVGTGVAAADGHPILALVAAVIFVPFAAMATLGARFVVRDPLRLTTSERRAVNQACQWHSRQVWTGLLSSSAERGLVLAAARAAERIARNATWRSGRLDDQRLNLDLGAELDQIDEQAHRIASARHTTDPAPPGLHPGHVLSGPDSRQSDRKAGTTPAIDAAWEAALNRVAALTGYANRLDGYDERRRAALERQGDPVRDSDLLAGSARDEFAAEQLANLTDYLNKNPEAPA